MKQRAIQIVLIALAVISVLFVLWLERELTTLRSQSSSREIELTRQLNEARKGAEKAAQAAVLKEVHECVGRVEALEKQVGALTALTKSLEARPDLKESLSGLESKVKSLTDKVEAASTELIAVRKKQTGIEGSQQSLTGEQTLSREERQKISAEMDELRRQMEKLAEVTPSPGKVDNTTDGRLPRLKPVISDVRLHARIVLVDGDNDVVVLGRGKADGLLEGQMFEVSRGDTQIARLQVVKVYPEMAGAEILSVVPGESIRKGDVASSGPATRVSPPEKAPLDDHLSAGSKDGNLPLPPPPE